MADIRNHTREMLPEPTLRRLPWYLAYVNMLNARNVEFVSSTQIAKDLNVDASQIAKDLSCLNIKGKTRIGYEVKMLEQVQACLKELRNDHALAGERLQVEANAQKFMSQQANKIALN